MKNYFTNKFTKVLVTIFSLALMMAASPQISLAWTSADLFNADIELEIAAEGLSRVTSQVRYIVNGGRFHGFDLAALPGAELVNEECRASHDDGRVFNVSTRQLRNGRTRVLLAGDVEIKRGGVTFTLIHTVDLAEIGALREYEGRARLDWTPLIWDEGLDSMTLKVRLPGESEDSPVLVDSAVARDYEVEIDEDSVAFTKFRPVRWYPMQVVVNFDPALVRTLAPESEKKLDIETPAAALTQSPSLKPPIPRHIQAMPTAIALFGLLALVLKAFHITRVHGHLGFTTQFNFLPRTGLPLRLFLSFFAIGVGLVAQYVGSLAAGVPTFVAAAALWLTRREFNEITMRAGGEWRKMSRDDVSMYRRLVADYRRSRRSIIDITTPSGVVSFAVMLACIGYMALLAREIAPRISTAVVIDGLVLAIPAWFAGVLAELPVDPTLEGFNVLRKWRHSTSRLVGSKIPGARAELWVREDDRGPVEVRLRVENPPAELHGIEIAGEVIRSGSLYRTRTAVVLRLEPGTEAARRLAGCPHAAEHHLTPDLEEEIIVLRNRRSGIKKSKLGPLRSALSLLPS
jgi:hypothetical protein